MVRQVSRGRGVAARTKEIKVISAVHALHPAVTKILAYASFTVMRCNSVKGVFLF